MRRRYRDINVFNLSMLDVIASAMGAFLIIMVVVIPYFNRESRELMQENQQLQEQIRQQQEQIQRQQQQIAQQQEQIEQQTRQIQQLQEEIERLRQQLAQSQQNSEVIEQQRQQISRLEREVQSLRERLSKTFLIIVISWKTDRHDVDLHVVDPQGHEFYYKKKAFPGVPGELSEDDTRGPGREVWVITQAPPGEYKVYYRLFHPRGNNNVAVVTGMVYHRDGFDPLPETRLTRVKQKVLVATITVHQDGSVTIAR